jgi:hypothetical protein
LTRICGILSSERCEPNGVERGESRKTDSPAILTDILFDAAGSSTTPTHVVKGVRYRCYVSRHLVTGAYSEDPG